MQAAAASEAGTSKVRRALPRRLLQTLRRQTPAFLIASFILILHVFVALTGPLWAPYGPTEMLTGEPFAPPSLQHPFGTDNFGRDVFSRVVWGERIVLVQALTAAGLAIIAGSVIGIIMAYRRGLVSDIGMRGIEIIQTIPTLIVILLVLGSLGSSNVVIILAVAFFFTWSVVQTVRAAALGVVTEDFVTKARLRGESDWSIAIREVLPNVTSTVMVEFSLRTGYAVFFIGALSFLGFAAAPPSPEWGLMISEGRQFSSNAPWIVLAPSLALASLVIALSLFTEGLSETLGLSAQRRPSE